MYILFGQGDEQPEQNCECCGVVKTIEQFTQEESFCDNCMWNDQVLTQMQFHGVL